MQIYTILLIYKKKQFLAHLWSVLISGIFFKGLFMIFLEN